MSKDDKTRTDLSHLGPPAMARRFAMQPRDEIAKFEGAPSAKRADLNTVALVEAREQARCDARMALARIFELEAEVNELKAQLGARDEALAAALELAQSRAVPVVPAPVPVSTLAGTPAVPGKRQDRSEYLRQHKRDARAAKKLGLTVAQYKMREHDAKS